MAGKVLLIVACLLASLAYLLSGKEEVARPPYIQGRNNTVLFLANQEDGLSNVFIATAFALMENHPEIEIHYASWARAQKRTDKASALATKKNPAANRIIFHEIKSPSFADAALKAGKTMRSLWISPWSVQDHFEVYSELGAVIDQVDPAVIVLDTFLRPAIDITRDKNRLHAILTPNTHVDSFLAMQPYGSMFWKFPAVSSGFPFPVPLAKIPENIYLNARFIYAVMAGSAIRAKQAALRKLGLKDPINFMHIHRPDVPWITMHTEGASVPVDVVPANVTSAGPILLSSSPAEEQDPELVAWLERAPTVLINLGSTVQVSISIYPSQMLTTEPLLTIQYNEQRALAFATAIAKVLAQSDVQFLWKLMPDGVLPNDHLVPLQPYINGDRVRIVSWLSADPYALLETGSILLFVHHGGSGCFHEAVTAGVPHVVFPLWADLYNFAALVGSLGVGEWACKETSPEWTAECVADGIMDVLNNQDLHKRAKALGETIRARVPGRDVAAAEVAKWARVY